MRQVLACRLACRDGVLISYRVMDGDVLGLDATQILLALRVALALHVHQLPWDDEMPEEFEKLRKVAILRGAEDRQMELEVGIHGIATGLDFRVDGAQGRFDLRQVVARAAFG